MQYEDEINKRLDRLFADKECYGPVAEERVVSAERELEIRFPADYRLFLLRYGASWFNPPYEIAGLPHTRSSGSEMPLFSNVIDGTLMTRRFSRGNIPHGFLPISGDGCDYKFYLDAGSRNENDECPVLVLGPGFDGVRVASTFMEFVEKAQAGDPIPEEEA